ncbi:MAG: apolipoprotein N-acyltransferase [Roseiflexaceae bacterium]
MQKQTNNYLFLAAVAILSLFAGGHWNIPVAAWLIPIVALRFFRQSERPWRAAGLLWLATAIPTAISWQGATFFAQIHPAAELLFFLLTSPIGLIPYAVDRAYYRKAATAWWITLIYPIAATAIDFFSAGGSPVGSFGAVAYSQREFLLMMQLSAIGGIWIIPFVIGWCASIINLIWDQHFQLNRFSSASLITMLALLLLGFGRVATAAPASQQVPVAGFSLPLGEIRRLLDLKQQGDPAAFDQAIRQVHAEQLAEIRRLAEQGARIVVLQEGAGMGEVAHVDALLRDAAALAKQQQIYIVLPTVRFGSGQTVNAVQIIDPQGQIVLEHIKYGGTMFEGTQPGNGVLQVVDTPYGRISAVICWDADFPDTIRQAGMQQVDLLFIPANDWEGVKDIHAGMATFRAVENGMSIFRQTGQGISLIADPYGRITERIDQYREPASSRMSAIMQANIPLMRQATLYPQIGDAIGILAQLGLLGLIGGLLVQRWRMPKQPKVALSQ